MNDWKVIVAAAGVVGGVACSPDTAPAPGPAAADAALDAPADGPEAPDVDAGPPSDASREELGLYFVRQRKCPSCHQSPNVEDGILSGQLSVLPQTSVYGSNITPDLDTGIGAWTPDQIVGAMRQRVDDKGVPLCPTMPTSSDMTDTEAYAIAAYLQSLPPIARAIPDSVCPPIKNPRDAGAEGGSTDAGVEAGGLDAAADAAMTDAAAGG